ncbi:hypothetical protein DPEC_G00210380 [Dallia pectoralis]|uniref:Uncharacterized protein n=1 Tax=Dallia pectoralis TaxID=75939 RepID=A0ACC2G5X1_DALPE|nr:hypothetical protein DPEC_G00210380 [Dallia pectoralis]
MRLRAARELRDGRTEMCSFLKKLGVYQTQLLNGWSAKQAALKQDRRTCIARMLYLFNEIAKDCKLHLFPPTPRPSNSSSIVTGKPCKPTRSMNTVRRCHRLPPIAQAIPLVQASAETKHPAIKTG